MIKRIRVCEIVYSLDIEADGGGITRFVSTLSQALDMEQFEPVVCGLWDRGSEVEKAFSRRLAQRGIKTFTCARWDDKHPFLAFYYAYKKLREWIKSQPVDIVHSHSQFADVAAMLLKLEGKAPVIVRTLHNGFPLEWMRRPLRRLFFSYLLFVLLYDREIGVSPHITEYLDRRRLAKILKRSGMMINNAVDLSRFHPQPECREYVRQELGVPQNAYLVGTVGRLGIEKGYDILIQAAAQITPRCDDVYFLIVGDGKQAISLKEQAVMAGIDDRLIFAGARSDVERLLGSMDLFVCSSRWEGLSTAILEAMATGVPIVATDIPGNRGLLENGKNAWIVPVENPQAMASAILNSKGEVEVRREFTRQGHVEVLKYTVDRVADQHGQLYRSIVNDLRR